MIEFIKYLDGKEWREFTDRDITRSHALDLFSNRVTVTVKEDGVFITNSESMRKTYRKAGHRAMMLSDIPPSDRLISDVGFLGGT
jgi:hypothetical protein